MQNVRLKNIAPCGNEKQVKEIYLQHAPGLIFFARKFVDSFTAEDIVHDVFLKLYHQDPGKLNENGIRAYLFSMVKNGCLDYLQHLKVEKTYVAKAQAQLKIEELRWYDSNENIVSNEKLNAIYNEIEKLPPQCKRIFIKSYLEEQKHADIAEELNISVRTVEAQVYKALKIIRDKLILFLLPFII
ncbi:MAG TPA: RNA polymerase sigma-70 factor [Bacteroidales bacterium]|nr:RNA polymerase sigma-70 factor [Bacteroidales bacterium]